MFEKLKGTFGDSKKFSKKVSQSRKRGWEKSQCQKGEPISFGMVLYFMLEAFGCVQNKVLSNKYLW